MMGNDGRGYCRTEAAARAEALEMSKRQGRAESFEMSKIRQQLTASKRFVEIFLLEPSSKCLLEPSSKCPLEPSPKCPCHPS